MTGLSFMTLLLILLASVFIHDNINNIIWFLGILRRRQFARSWIMQAIAGIYRKNLLYRFTFTLFLLLLCALPILLGGCAATTPVNTPPVNIPLLEKWSGDYPVSELGRLPDGQQAVAAGYIGDTEAFIPVWRAFMPEEILPTVDFSENIVVFTRNIQFYNRTNILKVEISGDGAAEIIAMETMSAIPIEEKVALSMAVIPRKGIVYIQSGTEKTPVIPHK